MALAQVHLTLLSSANKVGQRAIVWLWTHIELAVVNTILWAVQQFGLLASTPRGALQQLCCWTCKRHKHTQKDQSHTAESDKPPTELPYRNHIKAASQQELRTQHRHTRTHTHIQQHKAEQTLLSMKRIHLLENPVKTLMHTKQIAQDNTTSQHETA